MAENKTLAQAMQEVDNSEIEATASAAEAGEETTETPEQKPDEGEGDDGNEEGEEGDDETAESAGDADEGDTDDEGDEEEDEEDEDSESAGEAEDDFGLTPKQIQAIKDNPETYKLYKALMKGYTTSTQRNAEAAKLAAAFKRNPDGVLEAIAKSRGYELRKPAGTPAATEQATQSAIDIAGQKIEKLFGEKAGPQVRQIFEEFISTVVSDKIAPLGATVGHVVSQGEKARMTSEEAAFKARHRDVLTPEIEEEVVRLGNSGQFIPGDDVTPSKYLDTLLEVTLARRERRNASRNLAKRIKNNKADEEPARGIGAKSGIKPVTKIRPNMSISEAFDAAAEELNAE